MGSQIRLVEVMVVQYYSNRAVERLREIASTLMFIQRFTRQLWRTVYRGLVTLPHLAILLGAWRRSQKFWCEPTITFKKQWILRPQLWASPFGSIRLVSGRLWT